MNSHQSNQHIEYTLPEFQYVLSIIGRVDLHKESLQVTLVSVLEEYMMRPAVSKTSIIPNDMARILEFCKCKHFILVVLFGVFRNVGFEDESIRIFRT
jgi:hypothetical protein